VTRMHGRARRVTRMHGWSVTARTGESRRVTASERWASARGTTRVSREKGLPGRGWRLNPPLRQSETERQRDRERQRETERQGKFHPLGGPAENGGRVDRSEEGLRRLRVSDLERTAHAPGAGAWQVSGRGPGRRGGGRRCCASWSSCGRAAPPPCRGHRPPAVGSTDERRRGRLQPPPPGDHRAKP
jgi:hypothetical protein